MNQHRCDEVERLTRALASMTAERDAALLGANLTQGASKVFLRGWQEERRALVADRDRLAEDARRLREALGRAVNESRHADGCSADSPWYECVCWKFEARNALAEHDAQAAKRTRSRGREDET